MNTRRVLSLVLALMMGLLVMSAVWAQSGSGYDLTWWTADGGGGTVSGGTYELSGTIGQPDTGVLSGGGYTLAGGFWSGVAPAPPGHKLYLPLIMKNRPAW